MRGMQGIPSGTLFMEMNNNAEPHRLPGKGERMTQRERGREVEREKERSRQGEGESDEGQLLKT